MAWRIRGRTRALSCLVLLVPMWAGAQPAEGRLDVGAHVALAKSGEFESTDAGIGARIGWRLWRGVGIEAEITHYPATFPESRGFSEGLWEGLVGATVGLSRDRFRPFARIRPGWLRVQEAEGPIVCIAIFPPPLSCTLAAGRTLAALDVGGGVEVAVTPRTFFRLDLGDRMLWYPGTVLRGRGAVADESFLSHDLRFAAGGGLRF